MFRGLSTAVPHSGQMSESPTRYPHRVHWLRFDRKRLRIARARTRQANSSAAKMTVSAASPLQIGTSGSARGTATFSLALLRQGPAGIAMPPKSSNGFGACCHSHRSAKKGSPRASSIVLGRLRSSRGGGRVRRATLQLGMPLASTVLDEPGLSRGTHHARKVPIGDE